MIPTEWSLSHSILNMIWGQWGRPLVDLFATRDNTRLPVFVSPVPDALALDTDALAIPWSNMEVYAFPPYGILPKVLLKAAQEGPRMILIAPMWPWATWYTALQSLAHCSPLQLNLSNQDLFQPHTRVCHGNVDSLDLHAWLLCGSLCVNVDCLRKQFS